MRRQLRDFSSRKDSEPHIPWWNLEFSGGDPTHLAPPDLADGRAFNRTRHRSPARRPADDTGSGSTMPHGQTVHRLRDRNVRGCG
jgi:hypothetical protein